MTVIAEDDAYKSEEEDKPVPLTQAELSNLKRDLNFSKKSSQLLSSHLKEKYLLAPGTMFYWYQNCERELRQFFTFQEKSSLVYCNNITGLSKSLGLEYDPTEWRLFIDSKSQSSSST